MGDSTPLRVSFPRKRESMGDNESGFLNPLRRMVDSGKTSADELLEKFNGPWAGDLTKVYDEYSF